MIALRQIYIKVLVECVAVMVSTDSPNVKVFQVCTVLEQLHNRICFGKSRPLFVFNVEIVSSAHKEVDLSSFIYGPVANVRVNRIEVFDRVAHVKGPSKISN